MGRNLASGKPRQISLLVVLLVLTSIGYYLRRMAASESVIVAPSARLPQTDVPATTLPPASGDQLENKRELGGIGSREHDVAQSEWTLRDVVSEEIIPDAVLYADEESPSVPTGVQLAPRELRSDAAGVIAIPSGYDRLLRGSDVVVVVGRDAPEGHGMGTIWAYRYSRVVGSVSGGDNSAVRLVLLPGSTGDLRQANPAMRASSRESLVKRGMRRWPLPLGTVSKDGSFDLVVPRLPGALLVADAPGWKSASVRLSGEELETGIRLVLERGRRVTGRVVGPDGSPIVGARVVVYATRTGSYDAIDLGTVPALQPDGGITATRNRKTNRSRVTLSTTAVTDTDGRFSSMSRSDGRMTLRVYPPGHELVDAIVDAEVGDVDWGELKANASSAPSHAGLLWKGTPIGERAVDIADLSVVEQPTFSASTDSAGRLPTEWLGKGRVYMLQFRDPIDTAGDLRPYFFRWDGMNTVELSNLPSEWKTEDGVAR